jgi:transmembrane sensor
MSDTSRLAYLFNKYSSNTCSPEELAEFWALLQEFPEQQDILSDEMLALWNKERSGVLASDTVDWQFLKDRMQVEMHQAQTENIAMEDHRVRSQRVHFMRRWPAVAAILLLLAAGAFYWISNNSNKTELASKTPIDIAPGKDGAVLTLADGSKIILDSMGNGVVATQNGAQVLLQNGQVVYDASKTSLHTGAPQFNTMSTPKGRQFQLLLPDGTKVWLNAASSITYPTFFAGNERRVQVNGEVYFEVTKNRKLPFRVDVNKQATIEVLGTHFNVNAYSNETIIKTTLLEGSVKVTGNESVLLKPGQQAQLSTGNKISVNQDVDIDKVMAWKNGFFNFEGVPITEVMKQIERWYDITVIYEKGVPNIQFFGELSRNFSLADLVDALKDVGVHFRIEEGRKLVVLP